MFLVINNSPSAKFQPYSENHRLFSDIDKTLAFAKSIGYENNFIGINVSYGHCNMYACGDVNVSIFSLEVDKADEV